MDPGIAPAFEPVLDFWFGPSAALDPATTAKAKEALWWGGDAAADRDIGSRFGDLRLRAISGALPDWTRTPRGRLAAIILVDQFSRSIHRGTIAAFSSDPVARNLCNDGLDRGDDRALAPLERVFFYLPLEHSESMPDQERSVRHYEQLEDAVPAELRPLFASYSDFARRHREVIQRFGRFPHRNKILGRPSTPAEAEFLTQPGSSF
ncbi:MAG: putative transrane protein [Panacagrimonas sp.]|nr:DUF924 family protein [Panacagrimonas sp.]MCC2657757.1 putative transrane protein [Panacagrimonas sp.]